MFNRLQTWVSFAMVFILFFTLTGRSSAYSYGNPNEDTVAEAYKKVVAAVNQSSPDFAQAKEQIQSIKQDLDLHMGPKAAETLLSDVDKQQKDKLIQDMQKVLVLNIARRLDNVATSFGNYSQTKTLLAKALATYEALSPIVKAKDASLDASLRTEFDNALQALGNPGLFGVGVKEPDKNAFEASRIKILDSLQKFFNMPSLDVGHFTDDASSNAGKHETDSGNATWRNWIPIGIIVVVIAGVLLYVRRRRA